MRDMIAAVAGTNAMKVDGTRDGLRALAAEGWWMPRIVRGVKVPDNPRVPPQPIGMIQTREGAMTRACAALDADLEAMYGVGIENGIILLGDGHGDGIDLPVLAIAHRLRLGHVTYATGMGIHVEGRFIRASEETGWQKTCGQLIAEETGYKHDDWHEGYTGRLTNRQEIIAATVYLGFAVALSRP